MASTSVPPPVRHSTAEVLRAEVPHDPDIWLRVVSWTTVAFSVVQVLLFSFGRDHGAFATIASGLLEGQVPYRDLWDEHPPGIFLLYALSFSLFGQYMAAPRLVEALALIGVVLSCRRLGGVFLSSRTAGLMGGAATTLIHAQLEFHQTARPETFAGALTMFALVATTHPWPRRQAPLGWGLVGILGGLVLLLKPSLGGAFLPLILYLFFHRKADGYPTRAQLAPGLIIITLSLIPVLGTIAWLGSTGALPGLLWTLGNYALLSTLDAWANESAPHLLYEALQQALFNQSALLAAGLIAAAAVHPRARREKEAFLLLFGVATLQLTALAFRAELQQYQLASSLPLLGLIAGHGLHKLWRRIGPDSWPGTIAFAAFLLVLPLMQGPSGSLPQSFWQRSRMRLVYLLGAGKVISREELDGRLDRHENYDLTALRTIAVDLKRHVPPGEPIYVPESEPMVYWLSQRPPATRFLTDPSREVPATSSYVLGRVKRELRKTQPVAVVLRRPPQSERAQPERADLKLLKGDYYRAQTYEKYVLYLAKPRPYAN